ncbi:hypothetical protein YPPY11_4896, partial [Yersinia pestis PY-11]
MLFATFL